MSKNKALNEIQGKENNYNHSLSQRDGVGESQPPAKPSDVLKIVIPKFSKWQRSTSKHRSWIALSTSFFDDPAIQEVTLREPDAILCYLWLLTHANGDGILTIKTSNLKRQWMNITGNSSNRFDFLKRLQWLSNANLIEVQWLSNDVLNESLTPLETPQTQAEIDDNSLYNTIQTIQTKPPAKAANSFEKNSDPVWGDGLNLLITKGNSEQQSRTFLGLAVKQYGNENVQKAIETAILEDPVEPKAFIMACLKNSKVVPTPQNTEDTDHQAMVGKRKQWFRFPFAVLNNDEGRLHGPVIEPSDYDIDPSAPPWQVYKKDNPQDTLDIREWAPIPSEDANKIKSQEDLSYVG